jgi:hypothetical protein
MFATYNAGRDPTITDEQRAEHAAKVTARLDAAAVAAKNLDLAGHRFDHCRHWIGEWQGFLQETEYTRQLEALLEKPDSTFERNSLKTAQRARRLSYFGWRLAAYAALGHIYERFAEYASAQDAIARMGVNATQGVDRIGALGWLKSHGCEDSVRANGYFSGSDKFLALCTDVTAGGGAQALNEAYDYFVRRCAVASSFGPGRMFLEREIGAEFLWEGKYEPFQAETKAPFTFIPVSFDHELLGNDLLDAYYDVIHGPRDGRQHFPFKIKEWADKAYGDLNEKQFYARSHELREASDWDRAVTLPNLSMQQGYKRANYLRSVEMMRAQIAKMVAFGERLHDFIAKHREAEGRLIQLPDFERMVAKYNLLAACAMSISVAKTLREWQSDMAMKHELRFEEVEPNMRGYWAQVSTDLGSQLVAMQKALDKEADDTASMAAVAWLNGELSKVVRATDHPRVVAGMKASK